MEEVEPVPTIFLSLLLIVSIGKTNKMESLSARSMPLDHTAVSYADPTLSTVALSPPLFHRNKNQWQRLRKILRNTP